MPKKLKSDHIGLSYGPKHAENGPNLRFFATFVHLVTPVKAPRCLTTHIHVGYMSCDMSQHYSAGFIFVHFSGSFRHAKVRFFELGTFQTELDKFLRSVKPGVFFGVSEKNSSKIKLKLKEFFEKTQGFSGKTQG